MATLISSEWIVTAIRDYIAEAKDAHYEMAAEVVTAVEIMGACRSGTIGMVALRFGPPVN